MQKHKSYIKVEELIKLIRSTEENGYIEDELLQSHITQLKTDNLPAELLTKDRDSVYNIIDHLQAINKYQHEVKAGLRKSYIHLHLEKHFGISINKNDLEVSTTGKDMRIKEKGIDTYYPYYNSETLDNLDIVTSEQELMRIFKISKGTVNTWRKKGIIKEYRKRINIEIDGIEFKYRGFWLKYYDLESIREELKELKN